MGKPKEKISLRRSERILNRRHSLPKFEEESTDEADEDAIFELNELSNEGDVIDPSAYDESDDGNESEESVSEEEDDQHDQDDWTDNTKHLDDVKLSLDDVPSVAGADDVGENEVDFFGKLLDESITQRIVDETNIYSAQNQSKNWTTLSCQELRAFIGMLIMMGIHQLPTLKCYWSSDPLLRVNAVADVMPASRFKKIVENLHLNDNLKQVPRNHPNYDKLHKLRPLLDHLNAVIDKVYKPSSRYSIDESMIKFKGRCFLKQYMPQKPIKWGYKVWCLADAITGYIISFFIYTGQEVSKFATTLGERVVMKLAAKIKPGSIVAFDNFFTSFSLLKNLAEKNIFACGTVRSNSKGLPDFMRNNKSNQKIDKSMKRGEFQFKAKNRIAAVKWMDKKPVRFLSTAHSPRNVSNVRRRVGKGSRAEIGCPKVVEEYNKIMGGVDKFDQYHERYAIGRRSTKWWHRIFYYLIDLAIVNSYLLWHLRNPKCDHLTFRLKLSRQLINGYTTRKSIGRPPNFVKISTPDEVRTANVGVHMPVKNVNYRRCKLCSSKSVENRSRFTCSYCKVPLCITEDRACFTKFHCIKSKTEKVNPCSEHDNQTI